MTLPALKHEYVDPKGNPFTSLEMIYPDGAHSGQIALTISANRTPQERNDALEEFGSLAKALQFPFTKNEKDGSIVIDTGSRSPEGLMLFISSSLEDKGLVVKGEAHKGIEAVLKHEDPALALPFAQELSAPMRAAVNHAYEAGASTALARSGAKLNGGSIENPVPQLAANVTGPNTGRSGRA